MTEEADTQETTTSPENTTPSEKPNVDELVAKAVEEKLKPIKEKLDKAYSARDEALRKVAEFEQKEKELRKKQLEEEGKHQELFELQLAEEKAKSETLEKRIVELSRDLLLKDQLKSIDFKNDKAFNFAYKSIVEELIQDDKGNWVHKSGDSVENHIKKFAEDESNSFLINIKGSNGPGLKPTKPPKASKKSLFEMSQEEVLRLAAEGNLRQR